MHFVKKLKNYGEEKFMENNLETIERVLYQTDEGAEAVEVLLVDETLWARAREYWNGLPFSSQGDLPDLGVEPRSLALQANSLPTEPPGKIETCK